MLQAYNAPRMNQKYACPRVRHYYTATSIITVKWSLNVGTKTHMTAFESFESAYCKIFVISQENCFLFLSMVDIRKLYN